MITDRNIKRGISQISVGIILQRPSVFWMNSDEDFFLVLPEDTAVSLMTLVPLINTAKIRLPGGRTNRFYGWFILKWIFPAVIIGR